jgi:hypothetical protein
VSSMQFKVNQSHVTTDNQSVSPPWCRCPSGSHDQILISVWHLLFCRCRAPCLGYIRRAPAESTASHELVLKWEQAGNDVSTIIEESLLLVTITVQRLVKTTTDWDSACAIVIFKVCKSVRLLELLVLTSYRSPINLITNPNPVFSH